MSRILPVAALLALTACSGSFDERVHERVQQAIPMSAPGTVNVENIAGTVTVAAWTKPVVEVEATKYGYDVQELRSTAIEVRKEGSSIFIATRYGSGMHHGGVRYDIRLPETASLHVSNVAGRIDISGARGDVTAQTQAGTIVADLGRVAGGRSVDLQATTGAIRLWIAPDSDAGIDAHSAVGAFSTDIPNITQSRENIIGMRAAGTIGSGSARIRLATTTGAIALRER